MLDTNRPRLMWVFVLGILAVLATVYQDEFTGIMSETLYLMQFPLYACMFYSMFDFVVDRTMDVFERVQRAKLETSASLLAGRMAGLTREQLDMMRVALGMAIEAQEAEDDTTLIDGIAVPNTWLRTFFSDAIRVGDGMRLKPVRGYAEGSTDRLYARTVSEHLVKRGVAQAASGNQPVRVYNSAEAYRVLGWE